MAVATEPLTADAPRLDARSLRRWKTYVAPVVRVLWRPRLDGVEHLPAGAFMMVANHSGQGNAEIMSLISTYLERVGEGRPIAAMVHPSSMNAWPQGAWMRGLGAIPSTYEAAEATLAAGTPVLVFPGGDHEAMRPIWQANRVDFAGRMGFLKLARKAGVPIVPLGIRGSHFTAPVVYRGGKLLPRLLVLPYLLGFRKRYPLALSAVIVAAVMTALAVSSVIPAWLAALIAFVFAGSPLASLPWIPSTIRMTIGAPIPAPELFDEGTDEQDVLVRAYRRIENAVQTIVAPPV